MTNRMMQTVVAAIAIAALSESTPTAIAANLVHPACAIAGQPQESQEEAQESQESPDKTGQSNPNAPFTCQDPDWDEIQYED